MNLIFPEDLSFSKTCGKGFFQKTYFVLVAQELYHTLESLVHLCKRFWLPQGRRKIQSYKHSRQTHQSLECNPK